jgi:uncharacterized protein YecT (DUF1311 family)
LRPLVSYLGIVGVTTLLATGCGSTTHIDTALRPGISPARPILPRIHERFTALPCPMGSNSSTTLGLEGCAEQEILRTDKTIMRLDHAIWSRLSVDGEIAFGSGERSWLAYRHSYCVAQASHYAGGSIAPVVFAGCETEVNMNHIKTLASFDRQLSH